MSLEVGSIVSGKITGITDFGAFVELGDGQTGLVHISEVADKFVRDISKFYKVGDSVKVKVIKLGNDKIRLSIKDAVDKNDKSAGPKYNAPFVFRGLNKKEDPKTFEDMLNRFKQSSEEKMSDIKKNLEHKRGSYSKRR